MRMPIFSYFIVVGTALLGLLFWWTNGVNHADGSAVQTSQAIGLSEPFKASPELPQYRVTGVNFAVPYGRPATQNAYVRQGNKAVKSAEAAPKPKYARKNWDAPPRNLFAEFPHNLLSIR
jgi:hypothetical protein